MPHKLFTALGSKKCI